MPAMQAKASDSRELRKFLHDIANALNAAKINTYLLRRMHGAVLDKETADGLDSALMDAEKLVADYHRRVHDEIAEATAAVDEEPHRAATETTK